MIKIIKNFFNDTEVKLLNKIALDYLSVGGLTEGGYKGRYTTRSAPSSFKFHEDVYKLSNKVRQQTGIDKFPLEQGRGVDGINVAVTLRNGYIEEHVDPRGENNEITYRCNVITQKSDIGGELVVKGKVIELNVGDLHCYAVSEEPHIVTVTEGSVPRILWMFGCHIPADDWESEKIKVQND